MAEAVTGRGEALRRTWRNRALRRVMVAFLVFNVSDWACYIALLVWAYERGGVRASSLIVLVQFVPAALLASPAAARLGRLPATRALPLGYAAQATATGLTGTAILLDQSLGVVGPLAAALAVSVSLTRPVHNSLLPTISDTTGELTAANAVTGSVEAAATLVGPLVSGAVIALWAPGGVLLVMSLCAVGSTVVVLGLGTHAGGTRVVVPGPEAPLRTVLRDPAARLLGGLVTAQNLLMGMMDILLVVLALELLDLTASGPGWLNAAIGAGGLVGASLAVALVGAKRLAPAVIAGAALAGLPLALTGAVPTVWTAVLLIAAAGAGKTFFEVSARTFVQRSLSDRLLKAVFGVQESLMFAGIALGSLVARVLVEQLGAVAAFVAAGLFLPAIALLALPALRRLDASTQVPAHVLALLREVSFLAVLRPRLVERLALSSRVEAHPPGTEVVTEGASGELFYVVEAGELAVTHGEVQVRTLGPGDWFGELALLRDRPRTATVTAVSQVLLHTIDREAFLITLAVTPRSRGLADRHAEEHYR